LQKLCVSPILSNIKFTDEDDRIFYDTAKTVNTVLITGNKKHFPKDKIVLSPKEFIEGLPPEL
jgi:predicted nucleic acid-binding protein